MTTSRLRIGVVVPTFRRPDDLRRCLDAIATQARPPDRVVVVSRPDDDATAAALDRYESPLALDRRTVNKPGQVAALNVGLDACRAAGLDVVAFIDDDAAPRPQWLAVMEGHYAARPEVAAVGGRDWTHEPQPDGSRRLDTGEMATVGKVQWFGRIVGGHQRGVGPPRDVDVLKGANMSFRLSALDGLGFDERLRGRGAQVYNDFALCLAVRARGGVLVYDPAVAVDHYPGLRYDEDSRSQRSRAAVTDAAFNETLVLLGYLRPGARAVSLTYGLAAGTRRTPGLVQLARLAKARQLGRAAEIGAAWKGRYEGWRAWRQQ